MPAPRRPPPPPRRAAPARPRPAAAPASTVRPLDAAELEALQDALDALPASLEPLDVAALDGLLCAVLVQPEPVPSARWLPLAFDADGRRPAPGPGVDAITQALLRREAELRSAIGARRWFDPWLFDEPSDEGDVAGDAQGDGSAAATSADPSDAARALVLPWISGFAIGFEAFPALHDRGGADMVEALAHLYRHFDADDLEDADDLLAAIEAIGPALDAEDAVEGLVRGTLLLADAADALCER